MSTLLLLLLACNPTGPDTADTGGGGDDTDDHTDTDTDTDTDSDTDSDSDSDSDTGPVPTAANAGPDLRAAGGAQVSLDGSASHDPTTGDVSWEWAQTGGTPVTLSGADGPIASFTAPDEHGALTFTLAVDDGAARTTDDVVVTTVQTGAGAADVDDNPFFWTPAAQVRDVGYAEPYVYLLQQKLGVLVVDATDPARLRTVATIPTPHADAWGLDVDGDTLYVAGTSGLTTWDVSDPMLPIELGSWNGGGAYTSLSDVDAAGDVAWLRGSGVNDLIAVDVSDPAAPEVLSTLDLPNGTRQIELDGDRLWVSALRSGLLLYDVSDPTAPTLVDSVPTGNTNASYLYFTRAPGRLYLSWSITTFDYEIHTIDTSDETNLVVASKVGQRRLTSAWQRPVVQGDQLLVPQLAGGVWVFDLTDPLVPVEIGTVSTRSGSYQFGASIGDHTVMAGDPQAVVIDADVARDRFVTARVPLAGFPSDILVRGDRAYVVAGETTHILDLADPLAPVELGRATGAPVSWVDVSGDRLVGAKNNKWTFWSLADESAPALVGQHTLGTTAVVYAGEVAWAGDHVISGHANKAPYVLDATDPAAPEVASEGVTGAYTLSVAGDRAFIGGGSDGLHVVDISDPSSPQELGLWTPPSGSVTWPLSLDADHVLLYADGAVQAVDVSDPADIVALGAAALPASPYGAAVDGTTWWGARGPAGVLAVDAQDPARLQVLGGHSFPGSSFKVAATADALYVGGTDAGGELLVRPRPAPAALTGPTGPTAGTVESWQLTWTTEDTAPAAVACFVGGGTCEVSALDHASGAATLTWSLPAETGPYDLVAVVGYVDWFEIARLEVHTQP